jgi:4-hydroxy-tetrahydrodipicolinate synthase
MPDFDVLSGPDHLAHQGFLEGCSACISGTGQFLAGRRQPDLEALPRRQHREVEGGAGLHGNLRKDLYAVAFAPAAVKKATVLLGEDVGESRYPIIFSEQDLAAIRRVVATYGSMPAK